MFFACYLVFGDNTPNCTCHTQENPSIARVLKILTVAAPPCLSESRIFSTQTMRSDFDLFLAFFGSWPLSNHPIGILLLQFDNTTFIYHLLATPTKLHTPDTSRSDTMYRYVGALRRFSIFCCFFELFEEPIFENFSHIFAIDHCQLRQSMFHCLISIHKCQYII